MLTLPNHPCSLALKAKAQTREPSKLAAGGHRKNGHYTIQSILLN